MLNRSLKKYFCLFIATLVLFSSMSIPQQKTVAASSFRFTDVPYTTAANATWYSDEVYKLLDDGVITPTTDGKFNPTSSITGIKVANLMFNAMKVALLEKETDNNKKNEIKSWNIFGDVSTEFWAYPYMRSYYNFFNKEMNSVNISREQFALAMVGVKRLDYNYAEGRVFVKDPVLYNNAPINTYSDKNDVSKIYKYYVELCLEKGIMTGSTSSSGIVLNPRREVTNAEAAQFIYNVLYAENEDHTPKVINNFVEPTAGDIIAPSITAVQRDINVGIMILDRATNPQVGQTDPLNTDPDFFMKLDNNINKPMDWNLVNPKATITDKNQKAYWEVDLNLANAQDLVNTFDLLFQTSHTTINLNQANSNMIKDFITKGGQMWWENCGGMSISGNNFLNFGFAKNQDIPAGQKRYDQIANDEINGHPLLNSIFKISPTSSTRASSNSYSLHNTEISSLGDLDEYYRKPTAYITGLTLDNGKPKYTNSIITDSSGKPFTVNTDIVVRNTTNSAITPFFPSAAASTIGKGRLIVTANDIACGICDVVSGGGNGVEDFKFSYNLIGWTGRAVVDFREMEGKTWEEINPTRIELTATISNFGGREEEYTVNPIIEQGNWQLTTPTTPTAITTTGSVIELYSSSDGNKQGYPKIIKLKPNESIRVPYTLKSINSMIPNTLYKFKVNVAAVDNPDRDTDNAPYSMSVNSIVLKEPTLAYDVNNVTVDSKTNYCIASYIELTIPSPLSLGDVVPTDGYDYMFYFNAYRIENNSSLSLLESRTNHPGTTYDDKKTYKDTYIYSEIKENAKLIDTTGATSESAIVGVSCVVESVSGTAMSLVTIPNVKFTNNYQKLKTKIYIDGLSNKNEYKISGYVYRLPDGKTSPNVSKEFYLNKEYTNPSISVSKLIRTNNKYNATLKCTIPRYTDEGSTPQLIIKSGSTTVASIVSPAGANASAVTFENLLFEGLPLDRTLSAEITTVSTPLNSTTTRKIPLLVDIN